ncbi:MAG: UvrD-helicase domain-containing protein, partial [Deltaproteobacteria bacterium]|nr:UvrD-helicase domain-containing protein [Deltaproteobacteria bacterium]
MSKVITIAGLNPQQNLAVLHDAGPLLLLAGAGSGKTKVITQRIAYLIEARQVAPENILAVTFTNKAAREMRERAGMLIGLERAEKAWITTFHALCVRILRTDIEHLGYKRNFSIYGASDQQRLIKDLM